MDDLSGLDWSSKPAGGQPKPPVMNSAFATMRPTPSPLGSGTNTPLSTQGSGSVAPKPAPPKPSQDIFSNLMHFGPAKTKQNLSLAERQAQLEAEKRKHEDVKAALQEQLKEYQGLIMGEEFTRGTIDGDVEIKVGDNLDEKLGQAEILVQDGIVKEIRDPAVRAD